MESRLTALFPVFFGAGFVFLGRWLYLHPRKLIPAWGILNREHAGVQKLARAYATFFIFFGIFASVGVLIVTFLPAVPGTSILALGVAAAGTWLPRPRSYQIAAPLAEPAPVVSNEVPKKQSVLSSHWKRNLAIAVGLMVLFMFGVFDVVGNSDVSKMAFAAAQVNPAVTQRLGEPVRRRFMTSRTIQTSGPTGQADIAIPISGPKGKATVCAVARKSAGIWKLETLQVAFGKEDARVNLLEQQVK
jgi:hypothetical protein